MKIVLIAHDQIELVKQEIEVIKLFSRLTEQDILVVDNGSTDGLRDWVKEQGTLEYIGFNNGMKGYGAILNKVVAKIGITQNLFILTPRFIMLPGCIEKLTNVLIEDKRIGAVSPGMITNAIPEGKDFLTAVDTARNWKDTGSR